ncbi:hypothetical protein [uncultured Campylobacter sp.]|uniref:hypothetical protein n=1 Tax=uncultured Campylobacter sp. TaxID=218934 RepID=UPI0026357FD4|nr:hypothetical protein [uncultured Campylobacter sp.]
MDKILEHKIYRNEILKFHCTAEFCFKFKTWNFIAARRHRPKRQNFSLEFSGRSIDFLLKFHGEIAL